MKFPVNFGSQKYPPVESACPDYWEVVPDSSDNKKMLCKNVKSLGEPPAPDFSTDKPEYKGADGLCNKQLFAKQYDITWEGVTEPAADACVEEDPIFN